MKTPDSDPSIEHEPHLRGTEFQFDPSELIAGQTLQQDFLKETEDDRVEHTVWEEPILTGKAPDDALTYARWIEKRQKETSASYTWGVTLAIALASGPWAILGAFTGGGQSLFGLLMVTVFGPVLEEMLKVAIILWAVEKRPFWFQSRMQIALCVVASAFTFAAVENVLYLRVYVAQPSELLVQWRWSVCVALHIGCSSIAALGMMRIWAMAIEEKKKPQVTRCAPYMAMAMVIHGAYNSFAILLSLFDFPF